MPVSVSESVSNAIRDSITNSANKNNSQLSSVQQHNQKNQHHNFNDITNLQHKLVSSSRRVLSNEIEYEEVNNYGDSVLETFKSKYVLLQGSGGSNSENYQKQTYTNADKEKDNRTTTFTTITTASTTTNNNIITMTSATSGHHHHQNGQQKTINTTTNSTANTTTNNCNNSNTNNSSNLNNKLPAPKRILYPRENIQIGWKNSTRKWQIGSGMMNVGNTCYLNSTLQAIFHVPSMANWLISDNIHRDKCEDDNGNNNTHNNNDNCCIICAMSKTLLASQTNQLSIRPYLIYSKLKSICKHLIMGRQEDAHEFLRYLVEAMEKSYLTRVRNYKELDQFSKETTPLNQILGGYLKSTVRCLLCGHISTTFQHFQDILLDIRKSNTVEEALDSYFGRERLEDMGYKCEACKKKVSATKQFSLERAPISLCVQLKRFSVLGTKINKHITIRSRLDLTKYSSTYNNNNKNTELLNYKLVAMVAHLGSSQHCGHYTAIGLTESGNYYQFDDSCVRPIALQNVLNTNAYIIFYELDDNNHNIRQINSTQMSDNENSFTVKSNGYGGNNNNEIDHQPLQQSRSSSINTNGNGNNGNNGNSNRSTCPKPISKLELQNFNNIKYGNTNINRIIGPQLPDHYKFNTTTLSPSTTNTNGSNTQNKFNNQFTSNNKNLIINGDNSTATTTAQTSLSNFKSNTTTSPSNKLVIHFKNNNNNILPSPATSFNSKIYDSNGTSKLISKNKTNNENNNNNSKNTDNKTIQQHKPSTLPSMPKIFDDDFTINNNNGLQKSIINKNSITKYNNNNGGHLQNGFITNNNNKLPVKSLVPYDSDDDDDDTTADINRSTNKDRDRSNQMKKHISKNGNTSGNQQNGINTNHKRELNFDNKMTTNSSKSHKRKYSSSSSSSSSSNGGHNNKDSNCHFEYSPDKKRAKISLSAPGSSSPPVVKTKAGLWQVTPLNPIKNSTTTTAAAPSSTQSPSTSTTTTNTSNTTQLKTIKKNPFGTPTVSSSSSPTTQNSNKMSNHKKYDSDLKQVTESRGPTVIELLKYSHRGYGGQHVLNWNGDKTNMEKQLSDDVQMKRKREIENEHNDEMDRGKQKKLKSHVVSYAANRSSENSGYNPFQEHQHQQNIQQNRRWNNNFNNNGGNTNKNNDRFQSQSNSNKNDNSSNENGGGNSFGGGGYNRHNNNHFNRNNNFRRNKYQQPQRSSHHHRNNNGWR